MTSFFLDRLICDEAAELTDSRGDWLTENFPFSSTTRLDIDTSISLTSGSDSSTSGSVCFGISVSGSLPSSLLDSIRTSASLLSLFKSGWSSVSLVVSEIVIASGFSSLTSGASSVVDSSFFSSS